MKSNENKTDALCACGEGDLGGRFRMQGEHYERWKTANNDACAACGGQRLVR